MWVPTKTEYVGAERLNEEMKIGNEGHSVPGWIFHGTSMEMMW